MRARQLCDAGAVGHGGRPYAHGAARAVLILVHALRTAHAGGRPPPPLDCRAAHPHFTRAARHQPGPSRTPGAPRVDGRGAAGVAQGPGRSGSRAPAAQQRRRGCGHHGAMDARPARGGAKVVQADAAGARVPRRPGEGGLCALGGRRGVHHQPRLHGGGVQALVRQVPSRAVRRQAGDGPRARRVGA